MCLVDNIPLFSSPCIGSSNVLPLIRILIKKFLTKQSQLHPESQRLADDWIGPPIGIRTTISISASPYFSPCYPVMYSVLFNNKIHIVLTVSTVQVTHKFKLFISHTKHVAKQIEQWGNVAIFTGNSN